MQRKPYLQSPERDIELFSYHFLISLPQDSNSLPQVSKSLPQDTKSFPQVRKFLPQDSKSFPQVNKLFLQDSMSFAQDSKSFPQNTMSFPQVSKLLPQGTNSFPQVSKSLPQDSKSFPQDTKSFPQVLLCHAISLSMIPNLYRGNPSTSIPFKFTCACRLFSDLQRSYVSYYFTCPTFIPLGLSF